MVDEDGDLGGSRVSIVIANYNYGRYLPEAIDSVLRQTHPPAELLVIDDASTDESAEVLSWYADDDRIRVHVNERNLGIVGNFARGVSLTSGDYVAFLGADNRMRSDYVEKMRTALDSHPGAAMAYSDMSIFGPLSALLAAETDAAPTAAGDVFIWRTDDPTPERMAKLEHENWMSGSSMYRRADYDRAGGYRDSDRPEDHDLFVRLLEGGRGAVHVREPLIEYRQHSQEQANTAVRHQLEAAHHRRQAAHFRSEFETTARVLEETRAWLAHQEAALEAERVRADTAETALAAIRSGGWWRLHERLAPALRAVRSWRR
jgi:glycosyltransferase involved in cell wall biosynthesis